MSGQGLPETLDVDVLAACERMLNSSATIIGAIAAQFGAAAALRVKLRASEWSVTSGRKDQTWWWSLAPAAATTPLAINLGWRTLRVAACSASEPAWIEARDIAAEVRAKTEVLRRLPIDFAFPNEPGWALEDMRALLVSADFAKLTYLMAPLFASLADEGAMIEFLRKCNGRQAQATLAYACDVVAALPPEAAIRVLDVMAQVTVGGKQWDEREMQKLACAMTAIRTEPMARVLARWVRHARFGRYVVALFDESPELARVALADAARAKSIAADGVRSILEGHARAEKPDEGSLEDAPPLLRDPPWKKRGVRAPLDLTTLPYDESIAWEAGERERLAEAPAVTYGNAQVRPITDAELAEFDALPPVQKYVDSWPRWQSKHWLVLDLPDPTRLELWNGKQARLYQRPPLFMLARFGARALDGLFARDPFEAWDDRMLVACLRVDSPRAAIVCARVLMRRRQWRKRAKEWLLAHAEASAIGLIPAAFGRVGRGRRMAERALRCLAAHEPNVVRDVAARYGAEASRAVEGFAFGDPLGRIDVRAHTPRFVRVETLPQLRTRDGSSLPREATENLVTILRSRGDDVPYAGIDELRATLDPRSLADIAWALFLAWDLHGRRRMHDWMGRAVAAFPVEDTLSRLAPYLRDWAQSDPRACIVLVDVLAEIGTDAAFLELSAMAGVARAPILVESVNEVLGVRDEESHDLGLDARGEAVLDLGGRKVRVVLDESLVPMIALEDGHRVAQVPRASKSDDSAKVAAAIARFNRLRRESRTIAKTALRRLERAMVSSRRFTVAEIESRFVRHPILGQAARRLVWGVYEGEALASTFRVVEDGTYADPDDLPIKLAPDAHVGIVHPIDLDETTLSRWGALFADYENPPTLRPTRPPRLHRHAPRSRRHPQAHAKHGGRVPLAPQDVRVTRLGAPRGHPRRERVARAPRHTPHGARGPDVRPRHPARQDPHFAPAKIGGDHRLRGPLARRHRQDRPERAGTNGVDPPRLVFSRQFPLHPTSVPSDVRGAPGLARRSSRPRRSRAHVPRGTRCAAEAAPFEPRSSIRGLSLLITNRPDSRATPTALSAAAPHRAGGAPRSDRRAISRTPCARRAAGEGPRLPRARAKRICRRCRRPRTRGGRRSGPSGTPPSDPSCT